MNNRFVVMHNGTGQDTYYWIHDKDHKKYNMPEKAVSLHFGKQGPADIIAEMLNIEWACFQRNPR